MLPLKLGLLHVLAGGRVRLHVSLRLKLGLCCRFIKEFDNTPPDPEQDSQRVQVTSCVPEHLGISMHS